MAQVNDNQSKCVSEFELISVLMFIEEPTPLRDTSRKPQIKLSHSKLNCRQLCRNFQKQIKFGRTNESK